MDKNVFRIFTVSMFILALLIGCNSVNKSTSHKQAQDSNAESYEEPASEFEQLFIANGNTLNVGNNFDLEIQVRNHYGSSVNVILEVDNGLELEGNKKVQKTVNTVPDQIISINYSVTILEEGTFPIYTTFITTLNDDRQVKVNRTIKVNTSDNQVYSSIPSLVRGNLAKSRSRETTSDTSDGVGDVVEASEPEN